MEGCLLQHPAVAEAAVVGVPHADLGEDVAAFVTLGPAAAVAPDDLAAWCRARLAAYKCPRHVRIVADLPRSSTGKVLKARLRAEPA